MFADISKLSLAITYMGGHTFFFYSDFHVVDYYKRVLLPSVLHTVHAANAYPNVFPYFTKD